ncbi:response regulator transcription factor [Sphingomonas sp. R86520]|uniref:response regulator transcription factor n=1 Tax=Sphingomonas sp. R86520 TaxID=3093859 RepID=UPI0036D396C1
MESSNRRRSQRIYVVGEETGLIFTEISDIISGDEAYTIVEYPEFDVFVSDIDNLTAACVVMEASASQLADLAAARLSSGASPPLSLILLGETIDVATVIEAMKVNSIQFLERPFDAMHLLAALAEGFHTIDRQLQATTSDRENVDQLASLTPRERNVFEGLIDGLSNKEIAKRLSISHRTVEVYRANLAVKLHSKKPTDWVRLKLSLPPGTSVRIVEDPVLEPPAGSKR